MHPHNFYSKPLTNKTKHSLASLPRYAKSTTSSILRLHAKRNFESELEPKTYPKINYSNLNKETIPKMLLPQLQSHNSLSKVHKTPTLSSQSVQNPQQDLKFVVSKGFLRAVTPLAPVSKSYTHEFAKFEEEVSRTSLGRSTDDERLRFGVDMAGFADNEMKFSTKGNVLIVEGYYEDNGQLKSTRMVRHKVYLPPGVEPDNLKVSRDEGGILYLEESWKF